MLDGPSPGSHLASSEHKPEYLASVQAARAGGWTCCLKYPNLYVFDEARSKPGAQYQLLSGQILRQKANLLVENMCICVLYPR